jgi:hypothetical protein
MWPFLRRVTRAGGPLRLPAAAILATALAGCGGEPVKAVHSGAGCASIRPDVSCSVLFLGNSYTAVNDLPKVFTKLAGSDGIAVSTTARAPGGATLADHVAAGDAAFDDATFNVVVLQEQSQIPASHALAESQMFPAATALAAHARRIGAEPLLLETWAHRDGWPEAGITTYAEMQQAITANYTKIARSLRVAAAPVGESWARELSEPTHPRLWQDDGSHPTISGTYLGACVLFASIFHRSPEGLPYHDGVSPRVAAQLQAVAWAVAH